MRSRFGSRGATPLRLPSMHNCHNPKHQVQQNQEPSLRLVTDSLDIVAIGIEKECAVNVGVVVRAKPRRPIVRSSSSEAGAMTCVHFDAMQRQVQYGPARPDIRHRQSKRTVWLRPKARMRVSARLFHRCLLQKHE